MTWFSTSLIQLKSKLDNMGTAVGRSEPCLSERMCRPISFSGEHPRPVCLGWSDQGHEGRSSVRDEQLPLSIQRSQTMGLGHLLGRLPGEASGHFPSEGGPRGGPRTHWKVFVSQMAWEHLRISPGERDKIAVESKVWAFVPKLLPSYFPTPYLVILLLLITILMLLFLNYLYSLKSGSAESCSGTPGSHL